jgi:hypothetical protein
VGLSWFKEEKLLASRQIVSEVWNFNCDGRGIKAQITKRAERIFRTCAIGSFWALQWGRKLDITKFDMDENTIQLKGEVTNAEYCQWTLSTEY